MKRYIPLSNPRINLKEYYQQLFTYKGRFIADTEHSIVQFNKRFPQYSYADWTKVVRQGVDTILDVFKDAQAKYIVISKSKKIAVQLHWRKDSKHPDNKNHGFSATTLHADEQPKALQNDTKLFVEDIKKYRLEEVFNTEQYDRMIEDIGYYDIEIEECPGYKMYIKEGKLEKNFNIIEVD